MGGVFSASLGEGQKQIHMSTLLKVFENVRGGLEIFHVSSILSLRNKKRKVDVIENH